MQGTTWPLLHRLVVTNQQLADQAGHIRRAAHDVGAHPAVVGSWLLHDVDPQPPADGGGANDHGGGHGEADAGQNTVRGATQKQVEATTPPCRTT